VGHGAESILDSRSRNVIARGRPFWMALSRIEVIVKICSTLPLIPWVILEGFFLVDLSC